MYDAIISESLDRPRFGHGDPWDDFEDPMPKTGRYHRDGSLFAEFAGEIDAWARHALARSGFGDF